MRFLLFILPLIISFCSTAQPAPAGCILNYRLVPFTTESNRNNTIEIAEGTYFNADSFDKNIIIQQTVTAQNTIVEVPHFNSSYTWRVINTKTGKHAATLHHFKTGYIKYIDTTLYRLKPIGNTTRSKHFYFFVDYLRTLYNMDGNALWYLQDIPGVVDGNTLIRDLKATPAGTITFLTSNGAYEINYSGQVLWKAPNDGSISKAQSENYHHEFTRLSNGHYMLTGTETKTLPAPANSSEQLNIQFETLIEYDKEGKIVWSWKGSEHIPDSLVFSKHNPDGTFNTSMHLNSFYVDEARNCIYAGYRDISCIIKIAYPSGEILNIYNGGSAFKAQHSCRIARNGDIYLYSNNNTLKHETAQSREDIPSTLVVLGENPTQNKQLRKTWEFSCNIDGKTLHGTTSGGSMYELKDGSFFVSMGAVNRYFIVNKDKEIVWDAISEMKDGDKRWVPAGTYRASCIETGDALEKIILNNK